MDMDPRLYMLVGTFALLVIALVATIVSIVRASRRTPRWSDTPVSEHVDWPALPPGPGPQIDMSLEGVDLSEPEDGPTAALLTPLRTGDWQPTEEPALVQSLSYLSLDARVASFHVSTSVGESSVGEVEVAPSVQPVAAPFATEAVVSPSGQPHDQAAHQIAVVIPEVLLQGVEAQPADAFVAPTYNVPLTALVDSPVVPASESRNDIVPAQPAASETFPVSLGWTSRIPEVDSVPMQPSTVQAPFAPMSDPFDGDVLTQLEASLEPQPESTTAPESPPAAPPSIEPETLPPLVTPAEKAAGLASVTESADALPASDAFWESMFGDQADVPSVVTTPAAAPVSIPAVEPVIPHAAAAAPAAMPLPAAASVPETVTTPAPQVPRVGEPRAVPARPPRPKTVVHSFVEGGHPPVRAVPLEPLAQSQPAIGSTSAPSKLDEIVMAAPVEMWFGDSRIGVKAGTKTYAQFRKYADVLFADLRDAKGRG